MIEETEEETVDEGIRETSLDEEIDFLDLD